MTFFEKNKKVFTLAIFLVGVLFFSDRVFAVVGTDVVITPKDNNVQLYTYNTTCPKTTLTGRIGVIVPTGSVGTGFPATYVYFHGTDQPTPELMCNGGNYSLCAVAAQLQAPIIIPQTNNNGAWEQVFNTDEIKCFLDEATATLAASANPVTLSSNYIVAGHSGGTNFIKNFFQAGKVAQKTLIFDGCYKPHNSGNTPWCQDIASTPNSGDIYVYYTAAETQEESIADYNSASNKSTMHLFALDSSVSHYSVPNLCFLDHANSNLCNGKATPYGHDAPLAEPACKIDGKCYKIGDMDPTGNTAYPIDPQWINDNCTAQGTYFADSQTCKDDVPASAPANVNNNSQLAQMAAGLNKIKANNLPQLIGIIIRGVMGVLGTVALAMILYGGILWMTARGNSENSQKGRDTILWAALGIMVIFASYALVNFVFEIFR